MGSVSGRVRANADRVRGVNQIAELRERVERIEIRLARLEEVFGAQNHARLVEIRQVGEDVQAHDAAVAERLDAIDTRLDATVDEALRRGEAADAALLDRVERLETLVDELRGTRSS